MMDRPSVAGTSCPLLTSSSSDRSTDSTCDFSGTVLEKIVFWKIRSYFTRRRRRKKRLQGLVGISEPWPCNPVDAIQFRDFLSSLLFFFLTKWCESIEREPSGGRWIMMGGGDAEPWLHNEFFFLGIPWPLSPGAQSRWIAKKMCCIQNRSWWWYDKMFLQKIGYFPDSSTYYIDL